MLTERFRAVAFALEPYVDGTYNLLRAADAVVALDNTIAHQNTHDSLVHVVLNDYAIMDEVRDGKKIKAIKALRAQANCGLKEAKEAIEDERVYSQFNVWHEEGMWRKDSVSDEPPF